MTAKIYGVFIPTDQPYPNGWRWGMTRNKRVALRSINGIPGAEVRWVHDDPGTGAWDAPTFRILSTLVVRNPHPDDEAREVIHYWNNQASL